MNLKRLKRNKIGKELTLWKDSFCLIANIILMTMAVQFGALYNLGDLAVLMKNLIKCGI